MQQFQEGLGRAAIVCGALDYDRPSAVRLRSTPRARQREASPTLRAGHRGVPATQDPPATSLQVRQVAHQLERGLEGRCSRRRERSGSRRLVATVETRISPWFAIKVTPENAPWAGRQGVSGDRLPGSSGPASCSPGFRSGPRAERHKDGHPSPRIHGQPRERVRHQQADDDSFPSLCNRDGQVTEG